MNRRRGRDGLSCRVWKKMERGKKRGQVMRSCSFYLKNGAKGFQSEKKKPLDLQRLLTSPNGRPKYRIEYLRHNKHRCEHKNRRCVESKVCGGKIENLNLTVCRAVLNPIAVIVPLLPALRFETGHFTPNHSLILSTLSIPSSRRKARSCFSEVFFFC